MDKELIRILAKEIASEASYMDADEYTGTVARLELIATILLGLTEETK